MAEPALDNASSSESHVPWDSIGGSDEAIESLAAQCPPQDDANRSLTPWTERSAAPDLAGDEAEPSADESERAMNSAPAYDVREQDRQVIGPERPKFEQQSPAPQGGGWTLPVLCAGIALIACCVLIPQADSNRRLAYEREGLTRDLHSIEQQIDVNREFLKKVADDPTLAQRLAERQMKVIPEGAHVVDLTHEPEGMSPFQLVNVAAPAPLPPYRPVGGTLARICYGQHSRLYLIGVSLAMIATGLVLGAASSSQDR